MNSYNCYYKDAEGLHKMHVGKVDDARDAINAVKEHLMREGSSHEVYRRVFAVVK